MKKIRPIAFIATLTLAGNAVAQNVPGDNSNTSIGAVTPIGFTPPTAHTVNVVPLPPSVLMLGAGALGLAMVARRRRKKQ